MVDVGFLQTELLTEGDNLFIPSFRFPHIKSPLPHPVRRNFGVQVNVWLNWGIFEGKLTTFIGLFPLREMYVLEE